MQLLNPPSARLVLLVVDDGLAFDQPSVEVVRCCSGEEAIGALHTGRRYSAVVVTAPDPALVAAAADADIPVLATESALRLPGAGSAGAAACWPAGCKTACESAGEAACESAGCEAAGCEASGSAEEAACEAAGEAAARSAGEAACESAGEAACGSAGARVVAPVRRADIGPGLGPVAVFGGAAGRLVAVCGTGGTGASVLAAALAVYPFYSAAPTSEAPTAGRSGPAHVLLADLARRADQAFLHGLGDPARGLLDLAQRGRYRPVSPEDVRRHTVAIPGAQLLPGLRRPHHWTAVTPAAFEAVLVALRQAFDLVMADVTADLEGEREGGSIDVEERNHMARHTTAAADAVVAVGGPGANGIRRLAGLVDELLDHGVDPARLVPVVNRASAGDCFPRLCGLPRPTIAVPTVAGDGLLPGKVVAPLGGAVSGLLAGPAAAAAPSVVRVVPGSLGCGMR